MDNKTCGKCKETKAIALFGRDASRVDGFNYFCKQCTRRASSSHYAKNADAERKKRSEYYASSKEQFPERYKQYQQTNYAKHRDAKLAYSKRRTVEKYGLTVELYEEMLREQNGKCRTCSTIITTKNRAIDHCHSTNAVRGILCRDCNIALGLVKDNPSTLAKMIDYLRANTGT